MKVCVIGGGAAGMMAAIASAQKGYKVILLEKNEKLGKKIYITGKGRCNVTNNCSKDNLMSNVVRNPRFLYSAFENFDNKDMMDFLEKSGCPLKTERGNRVFPESDHASDVIRALADNLRKLSVDIRLNCEVEDFNIENGRISGVKTKKNGVINADNVIVACGGVSYPTTGSDGSMFEILKKYGHTIVPFRPALSPLSCSDEWIFNLQGLALKNVEFRLMDKKKCKYREQGEMLFTHFGLSGPIVLSASSYYEDGYKGYIDLKPALSYEKLDERLIRDFKQNNNKNFENALDELLPKKMIDVIVSMSGIDPYKKVHQVRGEERIVLGKLMKNVPINIVGTRGFNEAIVTRGGIKVKEVDPSTMKSKVIEGLSFAGEMLDLDALTGGYNLQIAWSTGYLAGSSI